MTPFLFLKRAGQMMEKLLHYWKWKCCVTLWLKPGPMLDSTLHLKQNANFPVGGIKLLVISTPSLTPGLSPHSLQLSKHYMPKPSRRAQSSQSNCGLSSPCIIGWRAGWVMQDTHTPGHLASVHSSHLTGWSSHPDWQVWESQALCRCCNLNQNSLGKNPFNKTSFILRVCLYIIIISMCVDIHS